MLEINGKAFVEQKKDVSIQRLAASLWGRTRHASDFPGGFPALRINLQIVKKPPDPSTFQWSLANRSHDAGSNAQSDPRSPTMRRATDNRFK
jgi:hypothetical protein